MPVPFDQAAHELQVSPAKLRRLLAEGAPQARRGRRGRGGAALLDVPAIQAWRGLAHDPGALPRILASELLEILAGAIATAFVETEGSHKQACAGVLAGAWYLCAQAVRDHLAKLDKSIPEITVVPLQMSHLREIYRSSGRVGPSRSPLDTKHA